MAVTHHIDKNNQLIFTCWEGEPSAEELIQALRNYQAEVKSNSEVVAFDELVDLSQVKGFKISSDTIRVLGNIAAQSDKPGVNNKLAIVVGSPLAYGLAKMFEIFRSLNEGSNKSLRVFSEKSEALAWIGR